MRGKVTWEYDASEMAGITPAYAGKSFRSSGRKPFSEGSPPPMRGKVHGFPACTCGKGITPAYAGKSALSASGGVHRRDHPRLCGEKRKLSRLLIFSLGSPPPMRGKGSTEDRLIVFYRITPAYAGKRVCLAPVRLLVRDHPRLCGEKEVT